MTQLATGSRAPAPRWAGPVLRVGRRMSDAEALLWAGERDPVLRAATLNLTVCDRPLDIVSFRRRLALVVEAFPRLRQRVTASPVGPPWWEDDHDFDLEHHVRHVALAAPGSDRQLLDLAADLLEDASDPTRPLWTFLVVEGLAGGRGALITKLHHAVTDGACSVRMSAMYTDVAPDHDHPSLPPPGTDETGPTSRLAAVAELWGRQVEAAGATAEVVRHALQNPLTAARAVAALVELDRCRSPLWRRRGVRRQLEVLSFDRDEVEAAAAALGGTLDGLLVTALCDAAGAYHRARCVDVGDLRIAVPGSTRPDRTARASTSLPARLLVPCGDLAPQDRFALVRHRLREAHDATAPGLVDATASVLASLPPALVARVARQQTSSVDFAASTLPGLASTRWLAGARVLHSHPMGPTGGTAFLATVLSSAGTLDLGLCCDRGAVLDPAELAERIGTGFAALGCTPRPLGKTGPGNGVTFDGC